MKKTIIARISILALIITTLAFSTLSCKKDSDGSPQYAAGTPALTSVSPVEGQGGTMLTLSGSGLGEIRSAIFSSGNVPAAITSTLNTDTHLLIRVPDTAVGGDQKLILTNSLGKSVEIAFKVIALPIMTTVYPPEFETGSTVTITGNNLDDVTNVVIDGTSDEATIVSKSKKQLVLTMPSSAVEFAALKVTNLSGSGVSNQILTNIDKAVQVFTDELKNGFQSWSWGGTYEPSTEAFVTGTSSMKSAFDAGGWGGLQLGNPGSIDVSACRYFTFWAKGAAEDFDVQVTINWGPWQSFTIPANTWTQFKFDLITAGWTGLNAVNNVTFQIKGADKTFYFDNIVFIK